MNERSVVQYEDIISLPHYVSKKRPRMPMNDRAAQFAGFAPFGGLDEAFEQAIPKEEQYYFDDDDEF